MITTVLACLSIANPDPSLVTLVDRAAEKYNIPKKVFHAMIMQESSYDKNKINKNDPSYGLGQLTPGTAWWKCKLPAFLIMSPKHNINCSALYFAEQLKRYNGNIDKALSAYNAGSYIKSNKGHVDKVRKWMKKLDCEKGKQLTLLSKISKSFLREQETELSGMYENTSKMEVLTTDQSPENLINQVLRF